MKAKEKGDEVGVATLEEGKPVDSQPDRLARSKKTVRNYMWFSMGAGLIPIPFLDLAAICGLQIKMIADLCKNYETPFKENCGKSIVAALLGYVVPDSLCYGIGGSLIKAIPLIGPLAGIISMPIFTGATTYAIGAVFIRHLEAGGTLLNLDPKKMREFFMEEFERGKTLAKEISNGPAAK